MAVTTTADERHYSFIQHINDAHDDLSHILIKRCWGYDDLNSITKSKLWRAMQTLTDLLADLEED